MRPSVSSGMGTAVERRIYFTHQIQGLYFGVKIRQKDSRDPAVNILNLITNQALSSASFVAVRFIAAAYIPAACAIASAASINAVASVAAAFTDPAARYRSKPGQPGKTASRVQYS